MQNIRTQELLPRKSKKILMLELYRRYFSDHWAKQIVISFKCFGICLYQDSKTQSCVNRKISSFRLESSSNNGNWANWPLLEPLRLISPCIPIWLYKFWITFRSLSDVSYSDECRAKKAFQYVKKCCRFFVLY